MKTQIETTTLLDYIELYNKYEYLIDKHIIKICPDYIDNEDFIQDAKLWLLDYIKTSEAFNKLTDEKLRLAYVSKHVHSLITKLNSKYSTHISDRLMLKRLTDCQDNVLYINYDKCDMSEYLNLVLNSLPEKVANILRMRFFDELTLREIAAIEGVSRSRIGNIVNKGLRLLRTSKGKQLKIYIEEN